MTEAAAPTRRERKKEETRRRIFEAALALFHEQGFEATTIDDITVRADVAKGTFFNYFPRKESIIEFLAEEWIGDAEEKASDRSRPVVQRIRALYEVLSHAYAARPELTRIVMKTAAARMCCSTPDGAWQAFERLVTTVLKEGQAGGEIRRDADVYAMHGVLISCFVGAVLWWLGDRTQMKDAQWREMSLQRAVAALQDVAIDGMTVQRGAV